MATMVLKGGRIIDPASAVDQDGDLIINGDRIAGIDAPYPPDAQIVDCRNKLVLPGLIDTHAHVYRHVTGRFGLSADICGVASGVTTLVDQGGPSCITLGGFRHYVAEHAQTRLYTYMSAYLVGGLEGHFYPELYRPECVNIEAAIDAARANRDIVKGIKAHAEPGGFARWGMDVMRMAAQIGKEAELPVYIHFGQLWPAPETGGHDLDPDTIFSNISDLLKPGDVLAHPFSRHPGGFVERSGRIHPVVREAVKRGLKIDVGYGSHFSFAMARKVLDAGIFPDTLGADMHGYNTALPSSAASADAEEDHLFRGATRFSLVSAMTAMMALGMTLEQVVPMVTASAAGMIGMAGELGHLRPGTLADVSVLADERGRWTLTDNENTQVVAQRMLRPLFCLRAGKHFDANAPILPIPMAA